MILGCDAAGLDPDGNEVVVHALIGDPDWRGDETLDPKRTLLSERHQGAFAERLVVPERNLIPKPEGMSFAQAACMPTAWLTAYRMLFVTGAFAPGETVLVQGAGGGVASAAIALGSAAGIRIWATSRSEAKRERALGLGADASFETGARLPERVDGVHRDGRRGDLGPLAALAAARRQARRLRLDQRPEPARRAAARLLPAAADPRLDDGHPGGARAPDPLLHGRRRRARDRPRPAARRRARGLRRDGRRASWSARSSSPSEGQRRSLTKPEGAAKGRGVAEPHKPPRRALRRRVRECRLKGRGVAEPHKPPRRALRRSVRERRRQGAAARRRTGRGASSRG